MEGRQPLTTQLAELGIPMVVAVNMMDVVKKNGDKIHIDAMQEELGCPVVEISALKGTGCIEAAEIAVNKAKDKKPMMYKHRFEGCVEHALAHIEEAIVHDLPEEQHRWYSVKLFGITTRNFWRVVNRIFTLSSETYSAPCPGGCLDGGAG